MSFGKVMGSPMMSRTRPRRSGRKECWFPGEELMVAFDAERDILMGSSILWRMFQERQPVC
jgi:hypothetical protein